MTYTGRQADDSDGVPQFVEATQYSFEAVNEAVFDSSDLMNSDEAAELTMQGQRAPFTVIRRQGNRVTVRSNVSIKISANASLFGNNPIEVTVPQGGTFTGRDNNNNNVPDMLEDAIKKKILTWNSPF